MKKTAIALSFSLSFVFAAADISLPPGLEGFEHSPAWNAEEGQPRYVYGNDTILVDLSKKKATFAFQEGPLFVAFSWGNNLFTASMDSSEDGPLYLTDEKAKEKLYDLITREGFFPKELEEKAKKALVSFRNALPF